ncbi:MAG: hypothetical protein LBM19_03655 [Holosporales bacterium]|jgi:hypothetical protein|nr:hypothetical protein [Holosporales bacterium]
MRNIIVNLFHAVQYEEFIRVVVSDASILSLHIRKEKLLNALKFALKDKADLFQYLKENENAPVEIVISNEATECQSITTGKLKEKDIISLSNNLLTEKSESANILFYEKKLLYGNNFISICLMKLSSPVVSIFQQLLSVKNLAISVSCWPMWIIASYFNLYSSDMDKFSASLFIIEFEESWEIIVLNNGNYFCYRRGNIRNFNRKLEIENTLTYIGQALKINLNDVAIYSVGKDMIMSFTKNSPIDMKIISKIGKFKMLHNSKNTIRIAKLGAGILSLTILSNALHNIVEIFDYKREIKDANQIINSIDNKVIDEIAIWENIDGCNYTPLIDFKNVLRENSPDKRLKNALINIDVKTNKITVETIADEQ